MGRKDKMFAQLATDHCAAHATEALAADRKAVRVQALREAMDEAVRLKGNGWDEAPAVHPYDRGYIAACDRIGKNILALIEKDAQGGEV